MGLQTLVKVRRERRLADRTTLETHYYISSLPGSASVLLKAIWARWGIENGLHWVLDVAFREDDQRTRVGTSPQNFAVLRHIALNLLKHESSLKVGVKAKRLRAAWSEAYLLKVLSISVNHGCSPALIPRPLLPQGEGEKNALLKSLALRVGI